MRLRVDGRKRIFSWTLWKRWRQMSAPVSFIEWRWSKDCRLKSVAHARSVYDIVLCVQERFRVDVWKRYVNDDLRVDGDKNTRLLAFAFTIVFVWKGPKFASRCDWIVWSPPSHLIGPNNCFNPSFLSGGERKYNNHLAAVWHVPTSKSMRS